MADSKDNGVAPETTESTAPRPGRLGLMVRALRHRNYRLFFAGQTTSLVGSWMQETAMPWLIYGLTGSPFMLGLVSFCARIPSFALAPLAGVAADRWDRRRILLATQSVAMGQALLLAVLTLSGWIDPGQIIVLALVAGVAGAFNLPAAQAFVSDIVENKDDLPSAIGLNSAMTNLARVVAPSLAGVLITLVGQGNQGEGICFLLNAASYLALLGSLLLIRPPTVAHAMPAAGLLAPLKEGFAYTLGFAPLRDLLILAALIGLAGTPNNLVALFARGNDASTFGFFLGAAGLGALAGAAFVASQRTVRGSGRRIANAAGLLGASLIGFAYSPYLWLALPCRFVGGFAVIVLMTSAITLVQVIAEDDKRGRVMSLFAMAFLGMSPLGNLLTGALAGAIGAETAFLINGCICMAAAAWFALRLPALRSLLKASKDTAHQAGTWLLRAEH
jgi:MFS family permease